MKIQKLKWTGLAINGAISIAVGAVFIFMPHQLILNIVQVLGIVLGLSGIAMLFFTFFQRKSKGAINIYYLVQGILNLALGLIMLYKPTIMVDFIMFAIGIWALAIGVFQIIFALQVRSIVNSGLFLLGNGIVFIALGLTMIVDPQLVIQTMLALIGAVVALLGIIILVFSYKVYQIQSALPTEENKNII